VNLGADRDLGLVASDGRRVLRLRSLGIEELAAATLNPLLSAGRAAWTDVHARIDAAFREADGERFVDPATLELRLPFEVADYVDFYSSIHHAANLGRILRPDTEPLFPNWRHLPVSYHGRAGTVVVSGTAIRRPRGLVAGTDGEPAYRSTARLDIELEVGVVVGGSTELGVPLAIDDVAEHIFGVVLLNDWSARDIQAYEYQPLGPHLGKSFATSLSAWVTPIDDLRPFLIAPPTQDPAPAAHLRTEQPWGIDLDLRVLLQSKGMRDAGMPAHQISATTFGGLYWTIAQQLAHLTANGAALRPGDLYASGTVSGPDRGTEGSLIELTWGGTEPIRLPDGTVRTFLEDGDRVVLEGRAGDHIHLGPVVGEILA